jgi:hypothetical protein
MRINYRINENNEIVSWTSYPIDVTKPYVDLADGVHIAIGVDKVVNGEFVKIADETKINRIAELKRLLAESDYQCLKHADGELTDEEYASIKAQRHAWRVEINELEA